MLMETAQNLPPGVEALARLLKIARGHSGQCDLTNFRCLDREIFDDCLQVLNLDYCPVREVHTYFKDGGKIWEKLADDWRIRDYTKPEVR
jgi:hypothetical protein